MSSLSYITGKQLAFFAKKLVQEVKAMATLQHTSFKAFIKRHPMLTYYVLTFAISWGVVLLVIGASGGIPGTSEQLMSCCRVLRSRALDVRPRHRRPPFDRPRL